MYRAGGIMSTDFVVYVLQSSDNGYLTAVPLREFSGPKYQHIPNKDSNKIRLTVR